MYKIVKIKNLLNEWLLTGTICAQNSLVNLTLGNNIQTVWNIMPLLCWIVGSVVLRRLCSLILDVLRAYV